MYVCVYIYLYMLQFFLKYSKAQDSNFSLYMCLVSLHNGVRRHKGGRCCRQVNYVYILVCVQVCVFTYYKSVDQIARLKVAISHHFFPFFTQGKGDRRHQGGCYCSQVNACVCACAIVCVCM